jgi:hypothetical protein
MTPAIERDVDDHGPDEHLPEREVERFGSQPEELLEAPYQVCHGGSSPDWYGVLSRERHTVRSETIREESVHVTAAPIAPAGRIRHGPEPIDRAEERGFVRRLQRDGRCKNIAVRGPASGRGVRGIIR